MTHAQNKSCPCVRNSAAALYEQRSHTALDIALESAPAYADWKPLDIGLGVPADSRYSALPVVTKRELRAWFPDGLVPRGMNREKALAHGAIEYVKTSGTTEEQVTTIWNQDWWNASERASWTLNSHAASCATGSHPEAILTSPICTGRRSDSGPLPMQERRLGRFLYLNEFVNPDTWTDAHIRRMAEELDAFRPITLEANPSFLARFARRAVTLDLALYQPPVIILTYEFPSRLHLRQIRRAFKSPIASSHGSTETGYVFMQCEHGMFHQNTEFCRVDIQPFAGEHGGPDIGRLLVTPFGNQWSALVRFSVGDLGRLAAKPCQCGRTAGLTLSAIEGRIMDLTVTTSGRAVTVNQVDATAASVPGLAAFQVTQHDPERITIKVVPESDAGAVTRATRDTFAAMYGTDAMIAVQAVPELPPGPSGKHRLAIREFPMEIEQRLAIRKDAVTV